MTTHGRNKRVVRDIAHARAGDKGNTSNISVIAYSEAAWRILREQLTAERVMAAYAGLAQGPVRRYELPNLRALNFVIEGALGGGVTRSLEITKSRGQICDLGRHAMRIVPGAGIEIFPRMQIARERMRATAAGFCYHQGAIFGGLVGPTLTFLAATLGTGLALPMLIGTVFGAGSFIVALLLGPETLGKEMVPDLTIA